MTDVATCPLPGRCNPTPPPDPIRMSKHLIERHGYAEPFVDARDASDLRSIHKREHTYSHPDHHHHEEP